MRRKRAGYPKGRLLLLGLLVALAGMLLRPDLHAAAADPPYRYYFPIVARQQALCHPSAMEQALAHLLVTDPQQQRPTLRCNARLEHAAQAHAADMAARGYVSYVTPEGVGMNDLVRQAGYGLPAAYSAAAGANQVASIAVGHETAQAAWTNLIDPSHGEQPRTHLLGLDSFFVRQVDYGIGHAYDLGSLHGHYWVIIIAEPAPGAASPGESERPGIERIVIHTP